MKTNFKKFWYSVRFGVFATMLTAALLYLRYGEQQFTQVMALRGSDLIQQLTVKTTSEQIALVEVTDADTELKGAWPWPRKSLADLVQKIRASGASLIVFTDVFANSDLAKTDAEFAKIIQDNGVVLARTVEPDHLQNPVEPIASAANGVGFVNTHPDVDNIVRRMNLTAVYNDSIYYSLSVETIRALVGDRRPRLQTNGTHQLISVTGLEPWRMHSEQLWRIKYDYDFISVRATDVANFSKLKNRIVIVGVATQSMNNWVKTPVGNHRSQWVQAAFLQSLFKRSNVITPPWADMLEMLISILIIASILKAAKANTPYACIPVYLGGLIVVVLGSSMLFNTNDLAVDWVWPTVSSTSVFALTFYYHLARKRRREWVISKQFGDSVGPKILSTLKSNPEAVVTSGEFKELTVIHADLRGFANLASKYASDATGLTQLIRNYMDAVLPVITGRFGTIDKLMGDGITAFWNAPIDNPDHAAQAVLAAREMLEAVSEFNRYQSGQPICLDIGINSGMSVVGNTGSNRKFNYTCIGEVVHAVESLEVLCKEYGVNLLLGESTAQHLETSCMNLVELDTITLESGSAMRIYTIIDGPSADVFQAEKHTKMIECYKAGRYDQASRIARELRGAVVLDEYYQTMINRCKRRKSDKTTDEQNLTPQ